MIKPEYKNISDDKFVDLIEGIDEKFLGLYEINKLGQIRGKIGKRKILSIGNKNNLGYPRITLSINKFRKSYYVHVLVANNFLKPDKDYPKDTKLEIDHINRNKWDFSINNLRIVSKAENTNNKSKPVRNDEYIIYKYDLNWNLLGEISSNIIDNSKMTMITRSIIFEKPYNGFYWKKELKILKTYYSKFSKEQRDSESWKKSISMVGFEISSLGVLRKLVKNNYYQYFIGTSDHIGYRVVKDLDGHRQPIHRLVAEAFIENNKIPSNMVIDHIDGIKDNNCVSNLRIVTQKENMNNPRTRQKLSKKVCQYTLDGKFVRLYNNREELTNWINNNSNEFKSQKKNTKTISINHIYRCCNNDGKIRGFGFIWKYKKDIQ